MIFRDRPRRRFGDVAAPSSGSGLATALLGGGVGFAAGGPVGAGVGALLGFIAGKMVGPAPGAGPVTVTPPPGGGGSGGGSGGLIPPELANLVQQYGPQAATAIASALGIGGGAAAVSAAGGAAALDAAAAFAPEIGATFAPDLAASIAPEIAASLAPEAATTGVTGVAGAGVGTVAVTAVAVVAVAALFTHNIVGMIQSLFGDNTPPEPQRRWAINNYMDRLVNQGLVDVVGKISGHPVLSNADDADQLAKCDAWIAAATALIKARVADMDLDLLGRQAVMASAGLRAGAGPTLTVGDKGRTVAF